LEVEAAKLSEFSSHMVELALAYPNIGSERERIEILQVHFNMELSRLFSIRFDDNFYNYMNNLNDYLTKKKKFNALVRMSEIDIDDIGSSIDVERCNLFLSNSLLYSALICRRFSLPYSDRILKLLFPKLNENRDVNATEDGFICDLLFSQYRDCGDSLLLLLISESINEFATTQPIKIDQDALREYFFLVYRSLSVVYASFDCEMWNYLPKKLKQKYKLNDVRRLQNHTNVLGVSVLFEGLNEKDIDLFLLLSLALLRSMVDLFNQKKHADADCEGNCVSEHHIYKVLSIPTLPFPLYLIISQIDERYVFFLLVRRNLIC
jgi:hypothetical protein